MKTAGDKSVGNKLVWRTFYKFLWPTLASSLTLSVLSMTDLIIAGHIVGEKGLGAISLAMPIMMWAQMIAALLGMGGGIAFSSKLGEGDLPACSKIFSMSVIFSTLLGVIMGVLGLIFLDPLVVFLGASESEMEFARDYIGTLLTGMPVLILAPVLVTYLRNDSHQSLAMFCVVFCSILNVILSLFAGAVLHMGMIGIGGATVISQLVSCLIAGRSFLNKKRGYGLVKDFYSSDRLKEILTPGSTVAMIYICQVLLTISINRILSADSGAAVYAVVKYLISFLFALFDGATGAIQPMLGIYFGEKEKENIRTASVCCFRTMLVMAGFVFLLLETAAPLFCHIFGVESPDIMDMAVHAIHMVGIYSFSAAAVTFLNSYYRCTGKSKWSFYISLADNLIVPMSLIGVFVYGLKAGSMGVFWAICTSAYFTLIFWCFLSRPVRKKEDGPGFRLASYEELFLSGVKIPSEEGSFHKIVPVSQNEVEQLIAEVEQYCEGMEIDMKKQFYINLSIEELIVNVMGIAEKNNQKSKRDQQYYADILIRPMEDGKVHLRIRDDLTEWTPGSTELTEEDIMADTIDGGVNELGLEIIRKIAEQYSYKRTIGFNNFSVVL